MTPSNGEYGRKVLAAVLLVKVWEDRGSAVGRGPPLGFQCGRPWAPEPDGWILYRSTECFSGHRETSFSVFLLAPSINCLLSLNKMLLFVVVVFLIV